MSSKCFKLEQFELEQFYHSKIRTFFKSYKNSKIFLFYAELRDILWKLQCKDGLLQINQRNTTYEFDVTSKTIKNWLSELQKLGFLEFKYKKFDLCMLYTNEEL
ncbi:hypothetical protein BKH42_02635 [Helicobacter sp. 13S00482-2]|uniref:hypothetical protein n=1 Tax=Helicobacter sp. 13S00482-2 TaxID=1476200 RepID=UPI000BA5BBD7|nr:hypothetical protein [Helicobacter sp. 13S00482-2]PAF54127.1 hypothetical protein BKH42_02635 [Helicobacter sp. 13S00482-2]